jgi:hypothetical protein
MRLADALRVRDEAVADAPFGVAVELLAAAWLGRVLGARAGRTQTGRHHRQQCRPDPTPHRDLLLQ